MAQDSDYLLLDVLCSMLRLGVLPSPVIGGVVVPLPCSNTCDGLVGTAPGTVAFTRISLGLGTSGFGAAAKGSSSWLVM